MGSVGVIGLGYVGLPLAVAFARAGTRVVAVDVDSSKIAALKAGRSYIEDVSTQELAGARDLITPASDYSELSSCEAIVICVPTPLSANREPDLAPLLASARALGGVLRGEQLVVLESTTYPGTTREQLLPLLEQGSGLRAGSDFALAFSPERVDPGRVDRTLRDTPKVVGGMTEACGDLAERLYRTICDEVIRVSSPEVAEMSKLLENIFRSVNIALVNELAVLSNRMGIDVWEVIGAAATKPYGFMRFDPGPGMGGHCLPVDPFYLAWRAREFDMPVEFIELAGKVNQQMPYHCVERVQLALNSLERSVRGARVAIIGVAYKPGVSDIRESPALKIVELLQERGAQVVYHDPHVPALAQFELESAPLDDVLEGADIAVIVCAHPSIDHDALGSRVPLVLDLRGVTAPAGNVVRL